MLAFILRRVGQAILVMLAVGLIAFSLFRFVGDPVVFMLGQDATDEQGARSRATSASTGRSTCSTRASSPTRRAANSA